MSIMNSCVELSKKKRKKLCHQGTYLCFRHRNYCMLLKRVWCEPLFQCSALAKDALCFFFFLKKTTDQTNFQRHNTIKLCLCTAFINYRNCCISMDGGIDSVEGDIILKSMVPKKIPCGHHFAGFPFPTYHCFVSCPSI